MQHEQGGGELHARRVLAPLVMRAHQSSKRRTPALEKISVKELDHEVKKASAASLEKCSGEIASEGVCRRRKRARTTAARHRPALAPPCTPFGLAAPVPCPICLEPLTEAASALQMPCASQHVFHRQCVLP